MVAKRYVTFDLVDLDHRTGVWCHVCALPSVVEFNFAMVDPATLRIMGRFTSARCFDCGAPSVVDDG